MLELQDSDLEDGPVPALVLEDRVHALPECPVGLDLLNLDGLPVVVEALDVWKALLHDVYGEFQFVDVDLVGEEVSVEALPDGPAVGGLRRVVLSVDDFFGWWILFALLSLH